MAKLKVKLVLNEGGVGISLSQLASIASEAEKFLRYLAQDAGLIVNRPDWIARGFENRSVRFDIEDDGLHQYDEVREFNNKLGYVADFLPDKKKLNGVVSYRTLLQYSKIADSLASHEKLSFGLYRADEESPFIYKPLTKQDAAQLKANLTEEVTYVGTIQGRIHNIAIADLWFFLRQTETESLIRCEFGEETYKDIIKAAQSRTTRIFVRGRIRARRIDKAVQKVAVVAVKAMPTLSGERYRSFFGADPDYAGSMTGSEFIDRARDHE